MALRTVQQAADQKGKPVFLHFETPNKENLKDGHINLDLNKIMQNIGSEQFVYGAFTTAFEEDSRIKEMVKNYNQDGIQLKTKEDGDTPTQPDSGDSVEKMAKRATDVGDSL